MKTATTHSTAAETILAIDLGRYKSVACVYDSAPPASGRFHRLDTNRTDLGRLFQNHPSAAGRRRSLRPTPAGSTT